MKKTLYNLIDTITFWASTSTLICCVLPAVVVSIAGGATMISIISTFPFIVTLSQYKDLLFIISGILIGLSYLGIKRRKIIFSLNHGWKYSSNSYPLKLKSYWNSRLNLGVCADWFNGPRLESGWISANDLYKKINR